MHELYITYVDRVSTNIDLTLSFHVDTHVSKSNVPKLHFDVVSSNETLLFIHTVQGSYLAATCSVSRSVKL